MSKRLPPSHTDIKSFAESNPMDQRLEEANLHAVVNGVAISVIPNFEMRGLLITIEESEDRIRELAFISPVAIRNAVYAVVNALGEPLRFTGMGRDPSHRSWYEFAAERQWDDE